MKCDPVQKSTLTVRPRDPFADAIERICKDVGVDDVSREDARWPLVASLLLVLDVDRPRVAIDDDGNLYIVEDRNGGSDDDIWFVKDVNHDGDLNDPGEGIARWASNGTVGSEFTGLYFDPTDKRRAWVNIQHPASGNDRTIEITIR
jgi:hypothetical protein